MAGWMKYRDSCGKVHELKDQLNGLVMTRDGLFKSEASVAQKIEGVQREVREMEAEVLEMEDRLRMEGSSREWEGKLRSAV